MGSVGEGNLGLMDLLFKKENQNGNREYCKKSSRDNIMAADKIDKALRRIKTDKMIEILDSIIKLLSEVEIVLPKDYKERLYNYYNNATKDKYPELS